VAAIWLSPFYRSPMADSGYAQELGLPDAEIPPGRVVDVGGRDPERVLLDRRGD